MMQIDLRRTAAVLVGAAMVAGIAYLLVSDSDARPPAPPPPAANEGPTPTPSPTPTIEPPPELANRGNDFDAIWRSINDYRNWLYANEPGLRWLDDIYQRSCKCFRPEAQVVRTLNKRGWTYDDRGVEVLDVELLERVTRDLVTIEVTDRHGQQVLVDSEGKVVRRGSGWAPSDRIIGLHRGRDGRWRIDTILNLDRR